MLFSRERKARIRQRLEPILREYNAELQFVAVFVDSSRQFLGVVTQLGERPLILKFHWVTFVSNPDSSLRAAVFAQLKQKLNPD